MMTRIPLLRPGGRRRRIGGVSFTVCTQKKGFRGNNRTYTHEGNKPGNGLISAHGGILDPIPPLVQPDQRGAENWRVKDRRKAVFRCPVAKRNTNRRITSQIQGKIPPKFGLSPRKHTLTHLGGFQGQITAKKWLSLFRQRFGEVASVVSTGHRWLLRGREVSFRSAKGTEVAAGFSEKVFGRSEVIRGNPRNAEHKTHKAPGREVNE